METRVNDHIDMNLSIDRGSERVGVHHFIPPLQSTEMDPSKLSIRWDKICIEETPANLRFGVDVFQPNCLISLPERIRTDNLPVVTGISLTEFTERRDFLIA